MEEFLKKIAEFTRIADVFQFFGLDRLLGEIVALGLVLIFAGMIYKSYRSLTQRYVNWKASKNLLPQFDLAAIKQATRIYIPTRFQNASPAKEEEPSFTHGKNSSSLIIPFFINVAFVDKKESERFYLILADSGMGKTTFMINLYMAYNSFFNRKKQKSMRLLRFSHPDLMIEIKGISRADAKNTILLLDALDEDPNIVSNDSTITDSEAFKNRLDEIIEATRIFCEVVITCRTQYFPGQEDDPYEIKVKRPDEKGYYTLNKLYVSPFNNKEIRLYLNKKFGLWPLWLHKRKKRASKVIKESNQLVMRPMMLSYIDYLIIGNNKFESIYDIYETLIEKWLFREGKKRKGLLEEETFISNLRKVSEQSAIEIYHKRRTESRMHLTKQEAIDLAVKNNITLKPDEITGQSLLTCDGSGNWKFAHKSILEFFLAEKSIKDFTFFVQFNFSGMDMVKYFFEIKNPFSIKTNLNPIEMPLLKRQENLDSNVSIWYCSNLYKLYEFIVSDKGFKEDDQAELGIALARMPTITSQVSFMPHVVVERFCDILNYRYSQEFLSNKPLLVSPRTKFIFDPITPAGGMIIKSDSLILASLQLTIQHNPNDLMFK